MKFSFDKTKSLIRVLAFVHGPNEVCRAIMALDTGATRTCLSPEILDQSGNDIASATEFANLTTANGSVSVPSIPVFAFRCLGHTKAGFQVHALKFPASTGIEGLLGLDFLRDRDLRIDFRNGTLELV